MPFGFWANAGMPAPPPPPISEPRTSMKQLRTWAYGELKVKALTLPSGLSCCVHKPQKVYTFSFIVDNIIPKSIKCIHSATKGLRIFGFGSRRGFRLPACLGLVVRVTDSSSTTGPQKVQTF